MDIILYPCAARTKRARDGGSKRGRKRKEPDNGSIDEISMKREELEGGRSLKEGAGWRRHNITLT